MAPERLRRMLYMAAVLCAVVGTYSMRHYLGVDATWFDALYGSLQLFTLSMPASPSGSRVSLPLNIIRFVAPAVTTSALVVAFTSYAKSWVDLARARRLEGHHVVCGDSVAAVEIAVALRAPTFRQPSHRRGGARRQVVAVADSFPAPTIERLRSEGVRVLHSSCDSADFARVITGAEKVVVAQVEDSSTLRWAVAASDVLRSARSSVTGLRVQALLRRPLRRDIADRVGLDGIEISSVVERVAQGAVTLLPLEQVSNGPPHAVLVANPAVAWPLATRLWASAGRGVTPEVALFGPSTESAVAALREPGGLASSLRTFDVPWPEVAAAVTAYVHSQRGTMPVGNPVYVWTGDASVDIEVALSIVAGAPGVRAVVISDSVDLPRTSSGGPVSHRELAFVGVADSIATGQLLGGSFAEMIASSLYSEFRRFSVAGSPTVEGVHALAAMPEPSGLGVHDSVFQQLAETIVTAVVESRLALVQFRSQRLLLTAHEIEWFGRHLDAWLTSHTSIDQQVEATWRRVASFELASRLPAVLEFAGLGLRPAFAPETAHRLTADEALQLAHMIHQRYEMRAGEEASILRPLVGERHDPNLAQALDFPLKLALVGHELRILGDSSVPVPADRSPGLTATSWLSVEEVEFLAEVEHRRWSRDRRISGWTFAAIRDNQRRHHPDLLPYEELDESTKDKDRQPILDMPVLLKELGLGIAPIGS